VFDEIQVGSCHSHRAEAARQIAHAHKNHSAKAPVILPNYAMSE